MRRDRHQALVDRWVQAIRELRGGDEPPCDHRARFVASGSLVDFVELVRSGIGIDSYCCESCDFPVVDPFMPPAAVIDAMLDRRVPPLDAIRALSRTLSAFAMDAAIEAVPESVRRALCESNDAGWTTRRCS